MAADKSARRILSNRAQQLSPFHVMDILAQARSLQAQGRDIIHLEVGEPDFPTHQSIIDAGISALQQSRTHYTAALGMPPLREAIADYYAERFDVSIDPQRIMVTPGASGALQLAIACLLDTGDNLLLADPGYPCNRNITQILGSRAISLPVTAQDYYQPDVAVVEKYWNESSRTVMVATPSNPTGTLLPARQLSALAKWLENKNGQLIVDEIYQGLVYDRQESTALQLTDNCFVINSFSKYFGMTGWRIGWMVTPPEYVDAIDRIAQNLFLAPPTMSQHAALTALKPETRPALDARRDEFRQRRDFLLPALQQLGFEIPVKPEGAFYIYANCEKFTDDGFKWVKQLLQAQGVALTPGVDFGDFQAEKHVRFAYTRPIEQLQQAVDRIADFIEKL